MVNHDFEPTDEEEAVLATLKAEKRANPYLIREQTGLDKGTVNTALTRLTSAGWAAKVTRGLYEYVDDPRGQDARTQRVSAERDTEVEVEDIGEIAELLKDWEPETQAKDRVAREETRRAVEWLRETGGRRKKSEFIDELADDSPLEERGWWERAVRPGLSLFEDRGLVEYRPGHHDYKWVGDGPTDGSVYDPTEEFE